MSIEADCNKIDFNLRSLFKSFCFQINSKFRLNDELMELIIRLRIFSFDIYSWHIVAQGMFNFYFMIHWINNFFFPLITNMSRLDETSTLSITQNKHGYAVLLVPLSLRFFSLFFISYFYSNGNLRKYFCTVDVIAEIETSAIE